MNAGDVWQPGYTLEQMERDVILKAYRFYGNNKTKTAESLGIAVRTIDNKLAAYEAKNKEREVAKASVHPEPRQSVEPAVVHAKESKVSVRKREEVQKVPS